MAVLAMAAIVMVAAPVKTFSRSRSIDSSMANVTTCETACSILAHAFRDHRARSVARFVSQPASGSDERRARCDLCGVAKRTRVCVGASAALGWWLFRLIFAK